VHQRNKRHTRGAHKPVFFFFLGPVECVMTSPNTNKHTHTNTKFTHWTQEREGGKAKIKERGSNRTSDTKCEKPTYFSIVSDLTSTESFECAVYSAQRLQKGFARLTDSAAFLYKKWHRRKREKHSRRKEVTTWNYRGQE
jgi:hypothetical protein